MSQLYAQRFAGVNAIVKQLDLILGQRQKPTKEIEEVVKIMMQNDLLQIAREIAGCDYVSNTRYDDYEPVME